MMRTPDGSNGLSIGSSNLTGEDVAEIPPSVLRSKCASLPNRKRGLIESRLEMP
jgi:hypothetical protein